MVGAALNTILTNVIHCYPLRSSQGTKPPLATYQIVSVMPVKTQHGKNKLFAYDVQLNIYATNYDDADELANTVVDTLDQYSNSDIQNENVRSIRHEGGPEDLYQDDADLYGKAIDIKIWITHN